MTTFLQLFLLFNVFIIGVLVATAGRHAYAHFRPHKTEEPAHPRTPDQEVHLSATARAQLQQTAEANFKAVLDHSATKLKHDLDDTSVQLNKLVGHMSTEIVGNELERYQSELAQLRKQAEADMGAIGEELAKHREALQAQMATELAAEKQRLIKQIDTKLGDAVASFLLETLQHNIDLGAQSAYLTEMLESHKADFTKEVSEKEVRE